jgi:hypothetical protein
MKMPPDIINFEKFWLFSIFIGVIQSALSWNTTESLAGGSVTILFFQFFILATLLSLVFMTSRRKNKICKFILVIIFLIGIPVYIPFLSELLRGGIEGILALVQFFFQGYGLYLLFSEQSTEWFFRQE